MTQPNYRRGGLWQPEDEDRMDDELDALMSGGHDNAKQVSAGNDVLLLFAYSNTVVSLRKPYRQTNTH
jgi:hypothetical protein